MMIRMLLCVGGAVIAFGSAIHPGLAQPPFQGTVPQARERLAALLVQLPYEAPPKEPGAAAPPESTIPPANRPLAPEEIQRAEALLPLLDGKQEFWAMGEFVHLGPPAVPVLLKALKLPSARLRYNAIETISMIKDRSGVPGLLETAQQAGELPRIREHALRTAVRLDGAQAPPAIEVMAKDPNSSVRKAAAFEARYVRQKAVIPVLITLLTDDERFVAISAIQSLWIVTRHESEMHDWDTSSKDDRQEWAQEWIEWWSQTQGNFQVPEPRRRKPLS
jgi:HEAT repeat protein